MIMKDFLIQLAIAAPNSIPKAEINSAQLASIFGGILAAAGVACVVFVIIGGFKYMLSQGDASEIKKAKDSILYALIGLIFVGAAFFIIQFVVGIF